MEETTIQTLQQIASNESLSPEIRQAAQAQLDKLQPKAAEPEREPETQLTSKAPSADFIDCPMFFAWQALPNPKEDFRKWLRSEQAGEMIAKHDAHVAARFEQKRAELKAEYGDIATLPLLEKIQLQVLEMEFSWLWERPYLYIDPGHNWHLKGQGQNA